MGRECKTALPNNVDHTKNTLGEKDQSLCLGLL